jgi:FtsH-binding integral membrane protein
MVVMWLHVMSTYACVSLSLRLVSRFELFFVEFLRKVYGIVAAQLCFVALVSTIMISLENVKMFFQNNPGFLLLLFLATMVSLFAVYLKRLEYPINFALLALFTFFESLTIGTIVSFFDKILVIQALILTAVIVVGLTVYTFQTKRDFSPMGASLYAILCVLIAGGFIQVRRRFSLINHLIHFYY